MANDLFRLFEGRSGQRIASNKELILAFSMVSMLFNMLGLASILDFAHAL